MSNRWTNAARFPEVTAAQIGDDDLLMLALDAAAEGSKQRIVRIAALRAAISGSTTIIPVTANYTPEPADSGAQHRVTAEAIITLDVSDPIGTYYVIANQAGSDPVTLAAGSSATLTTAGDATQVAARGTVVAVKVDATGWEAYGAFVGPGAVDELSDLSDVDTTGASDGDRLTYDDGTWVPAPPSAGDGDVVGPASAVDDRIAVFDGTTGKLLKDGGSTIADLTPLPNVTIREVTTNDTPTDADSGKRLNVTAEADISLDDELEDGAWFVVRAETADPVVLDVFGTATMSPAGPLVLVPFTAALCTHTTGGAWQVEGAFEEGS